MPKRAPSSQTSFLNVRSDAKVVSKNYNAMWSITNQAPLFLRRPKMVGTGKSKKRATYKNKKGELVPIPQKMNRCMRRFPIRVLLSAAAANASATLVNEAKAMRLNPKGEANVSGTLPSISKGAELAIEHALVMYCQTAFENALAIRDSFGTHKKVTVGSMHAGVKILNDQLKECGSVSPGVAVLDRKVTKATKKAKQERSGSDDAVAAA